MIVVEVAVALPTDVPAHEEQFGVDPIVYPVIVDPLLVIGSVQFTVAEPSGLAVAVTLYGGEGTVMLGNPGSPPVVAEQ